MVAQGDQREAAEVTTEYGQMTMKPQHVTPDLQVVERWIAYTKKRENAGREYSTRISASA